MRDPIPRPEPRLRRRRARLRRAAGPRRWKAGQHRVAPELAALVVTRPRAGVELLPLITLLSEDLAAKLDPLGRKLAKKSRWRVHVRMAEERPSARPGEVAAILRARDPDVAEPALLLELGLAPALDRARVREHTFLHAGHEHDRELETFDRVHGDERRRGLRVLILIDVRDERYLFEEPRQLVLVRKLAVLLGERPQLLDVRPPLLGAVLEIGLVAGRVGDLVEQARKVDPRGRSAQPPDKPSEPHERLGLSFGDGGDLAGERERVADADPALARMREQRGAWLVPQPARWHVEHPRQRERVVRILDQPQVREGVLHFATLIEGHAADDLVREPERAERVLDRP